MKLKFLPVFLVAFVFACTFTQCKKDGGDDNTNDTTTTNPVVKDYAPVSTGSTFTYRDSSVSTAGTDTSTYTLTSTGNDTTAYGKKYHKFVGSDTSVSYKAKVGAKYYQLASFQALGISAFEDNYLVDSLNVDGIWSETTQSFAIPGGGGVTATATLQYKIIAKGITMLLKGHTYNDVINVGLNSLSVTVLGLNKTINVTGNSYYAKGIGLIKSDVDVPAQDITVSFPPLPPTTFHLDHNYFGQELINSDVK